MNQSRQETFTSASHSLSPSHTKLNRERAVFFQRETVDDTNNNNIDGNNNSSSINFICFYDTFFILYAYSM